MPTPNTADAMKRHKAGKAGFTDKAHLKAKGLIPRADGTKRKSDKYKEDLAKYGALLTKEDLDKDDVSTVKPIIKQLKKSVVKHAAQAKQLTKDIADSYEKGRGPTGIAFSIKKGHPDAENPSTRKKYPERQTPEYKAKWNKDNPLDVVKEETITEIRKASVQFSLGMNSDMMKAKKDLEKLGHKVTTNNNKMTVTAKSGSDINRELNDIRNFYDRGVEITAENFEESVELEEETYQLTERDLLKLINKTGFTKADFKTNENDNDHSLNAIMLARAFGTPQEFKDMINIDKRHKERGSINEPDYQKRNALVKKYYSRLL